MKRKKILLLTNIISPYINDLLNHLSTYEEIDFKVKACAYTEPDRKWSLNFLDNARYNYEVMDDVFMLKQPGKNRFIYFGGLNLIKEITQNKYDLIIFKGGTRLVGPISAFAAKFSNTKTVLWEQNFIHTTNTLLKKICKSMYINDKIFDEFFAYGSQVKDLILSYNPNAEVHTALSPINNEKYRNYYLKFKRKSSLIRKKLGLKEKEKIILYVGRFVNEKNLFSLLDVAAKLKKNYKFPFKFILVGGGDLEEKLLSTANNMNLTNEIKLVPFQKAEKLSMFYTISDLFVLPSSFEPWGLVVNEAMNFNLPVIVSNRVGCANSLVKQGYNGYIYNIEDNNEFMQKIIKAFENADFMGENSAKSIKKANFRQVCESLINLANS